MTASLKGRAPANTVAPDASPEALGDDFADQAYHVIEARIVQVKYPPRHMLSEQQLSHELGISRTPIREALRRLAEDKLIQILPRKGAFVADVEIKQYLHLLDLRHQLELFAATRAAKRQSDQQRQRMEALAEELRAGIGAPDQAVFVYSDKAYKDLMIEACQNPFIGSILAPMHAHSRRFWYYNRDHWSADEAEQAIERHLGVMGAVAKGDEQAVARAVQVLFEYLEGFAHRVLRNEYLI
ncbi:GntR family transcriptional regulator [Castellaniella sp.]|uniref:GntR family transcriptional regulator n=1 Tax=Castellaniella sp. TaxID=1955812 RepID=UPI003C756D49